MSKHISISPEEAADRLAIRELVEAYAHCADRRDAEGQMALFTPDTHFVVYMNAKDPTPSMELHAREALAPVFEDLKQYDATSHFVGQTTIYTLTADRATGETYCLAHQANGKMASMICIGNGGPADARKGNRRWPTSKTIKLLSGRPRERTCSPTEPELYQNPIC
jgi:hypothetical protein